MVCPLYLNRLVVYPSDKKIDVTFRSGLNIVLAIDTGNDTAETRNSVGKSTFVDLIDYGLGSTEFLPEEKKAAKIRMKKFDLYLGFSIGDNKYTIQRNLIDGEYVQVYSGWVIDALLSQPNEGLVADLKHIDEYRSFLEGELFQGVNVFNNKRIISWRQIAPFLMRDQVGGFQELSQPASHPESADVRRKRIEFLLNLLTPMRKQLESKKEAVGKLVEEKHKSYTVIKQYANRKIEVTDIELQIEIQKVEKSIQNAMGELATYKEQLLTLRHHHDLASQRRERLAREILSIDNDIATHQHRIDNYSATMNEIQGELQKVDVAKLASRFFQHYTYKHCPTCLRPFSSDTDEDCTHSVNQASDEAITLIKTVMMNESRELAEATAVHRAEIEKLYRRRRDLDEEIAKIDGKLNLDLTAVIDLINGKEEEMTELRAKHTQLLNLVNVNRDVELYYEEWQDEKEKLGEINKSLIKLSKETEERITAFKFTVNEAVEFLYDGSRTGILNRSSRAGNLSLDIRYKNPNDGIDDGAAATTIRVIAFDLALLKFSVLQDTNHPQFLVQDSPNVRDIDPNIYRRIFTYILSLENDLLANGADVDFQYIITTIDIPDELKNTDFIRLTLDNSGERGKLFGFTF